MFRNCLVRSRRTRLSCTNISSWVIGSLFLLGLSFSEEELQQPLDRSDTATYQTDVCPQQTSGFWKKVCTEFQHEQILVCHTSQVVSALYTKHLSAQISMLVAVKAKEVRRCVDSCWCSRSKRRLRRGGWRNGWTCGTSSQTWRTDWPWRGNGVPVNREE